jgi:hypothetical protein
MEKTVINYASGGLGNILLPLSSCIAFAEATNRKPVVCWEPIFRCMATFHDLFENDIEVIKKDDLTNLKNAKIYGNLHDINYDFFLYKNDSLVKLTSKCLVLPVSNIDINDTEENVVIYHNNLLPQIDKQNSIQALKSLKIKKEILKTVEEISTFLNINETIFGVHARGTDFNDGIEVYLSKIDAIVMANPNCKIFLCSDSPDWEQQIFKLYPNNIILRTKKYFVNKLDSNVQSWSNNALTSKEAVVEGMIDMLLLAKTNFSVYNVSSSFAQMVKLLKS